MAEFDVAVAVAEPSSCEDPMEECLGVFVDGDFGEVVSKGGEGIVETELESHVEKSSFGDAAESTVRGECGIVGSTVEPTCVSMDDVDRLDRSFFSSGVLDSEGTTALPEEATGSEVKARLVVMERILETKMGMALETMNRVLEVGNSNAEIFSSRRDEDAIVRLKTESLAQGDGFVKEESLLTNAKIDGENLESLGDVAARDEVAAVDDKASDKNQGMETKNVLHSSNGETIDVDENKVSFMDKDLMDAVGDNSMTGFPKEDESMEYVVEVTGEGRQFLGADLNPSQNCGADLKEATMMEVEVVLSYEDEVAVADDFCDNSLREAQDLAVVKINESSFGDEIQVMVIGEEFPLLEVDGESAVENGKENFTSETESEVNGDSCLHKDEQSNTASIKKADAERVGIDGQSDSSLIDTKEIFQVPVDNSSYESLSVTEKVLGLKVGTFLGETSAEDHSVIIDSSPAEDQTAGLGNVSESIFPYVGPSEIEPQNLEARMVSSGKPTATSVSDAVNSDATVVTEETIESYEEVRQNPQGMVLNKCMLGSLVDLYPCLAKDKESVKEDVRLEEVECHMMTDSEFSEYFDGGVTNANGDLFLEAEVREKYTAKEREIEMSKRISEPEEGNDVEVKVSTETTPRPRTRVDLATHLLPEESEAEFSVPDLVWGKVNNHSWWPGQIYDLEDASEKAIKCHKEDSFLVAYFGDRTFAWNEAYVLKPFWSNFSHMEKQSSSEVFQNAISSALDEVSRRIMLGLACFCVPNDIYSKVECQIVENTGICQESSRRYGLDESTRASFFKPNKFVAYVRALAESPAAGSNRLGLVIAKAQLLAFYQLKGYYFLPEFENCGGLLESDDVENSVLDQANECTPDNNTNKKKLECENRISHKRKHNLKDGLYSSKRERRLSELMGDGGGSAGQDKRISFYAAKVSGTLSPIPKPSFKVGDCIRRAASQLTGSLLISRNGNEKLQKVNGIVDMQSPNNSVTSRVENSSLDEMLLQLQMLARDPVKGHSYRNGITNFFFDFRDSIRLCQFGGRQSSTRGKLDGGRKRNVSHAFVVSPEEFEFDDMSDSCWTNMVIQNHSEEQPDGVQNSEHYQLINLGAEKLHKSSERGYSRKRFSSGNHHEMAVDGQMRHINERRQANLPAELILNFEADSIPSKMHLNKTFRRFGPLIETETEIDQETSHARVVFKRCSDAEVAFSSAGKFSIFGPVFVTYQLNYLPSISFNTFPLATSEVLEDAA